MNKIAARPRISTKTWLLIVFTVLVLSLVGLWWWQNRPIRPVVLTEQEKVVVEQKVDAIQNPTMLVTTQTPEPAYEKGAKQIILTERELNGLLHHNTNLGESLKFELATNAIHARVEFDIDPDLPYLGGKRFKARARFIVGETPGKPEFVLDDFTLWGISLPNEWLGGMKGQNLFSQAIGAEGGLPGIEEFRVERGQLVVCLAE